MSFSKHRLGGPAVLLDPPQDRAFVRRQVRSGEAEDAEGGDGLPPGIGARAPRGRLDGRHDGCELTLGARTVRRPHPGGAEQRAVPGHDDGVHLRATAVDRHQGRPAHGRASSSSIAAKRTPARSKPAIAIGTASAVASGHECRRTTAPSPCRIAPETVSLPISPAVRQGSQSSVWTCQWTFR